jgi:hypothetical protein
MKTWFTELISQANERLLNDSEFERIFVYFDSLPNRLGAIEELERCEGDLRQSLLSEVRTRYPDRTIYDKTFINDIVSAIRLAAQAMLADEPRLVRERWVDHALLVCSTLDVPLAYVGDVFTLARGRLERSLSKEAMATFSPYLTELTKRFVL